MKRITFYVQDFEDEQIDKICEEKDISPDYLLSMLLEAIDNGTIDIDDIV